MGIILVIEDEEHIQRMIEVILKKSGHQSIKAKSGEEAVKLLETMKGNDRPNLILLDIMLGGMDGLQVLKALRVKEDLKDIPVLMITAIAHENVVLKGIQLGAKGYVKKPFHPKELLERVAKFI